MKKHLFLTRLACLAIPMLAITSPLPAQDKPPVVEDKSGIFRKSLTIDKAPMARGGAVLKSYADMLEKVQPAVVTILTGIETPKRRQIDPRVRAYYRSLGVPLPPEPQINEDRWQQIGVGSGVIVSSNGYILTNRHVVIPPDLNMELGQYLRVQRLRVNMPGREGFVPAELVDYSQDPAMDVAVLKIAGSGLPSATLADSDTVRVGDIVFAVGAPFGIEKTVTMGIISARRTDRVIEEFGNVELLQTDASINPGNSGGPLIDADGRVVGINTAIYSRTGSNLGIGFAIPINKAVSAADALSRPRGWLGVPVGDVDQRAARLYGFTGGAFIGKVEAGTPAATALLEEGDVVLSVNGEKVENANQLIKTVAANPPGTQLKLLVFREAREERAELTITLGERPNNFLASDKTLAEAPVAEPPAEGEPGKDKDKEKDKDQIAGMTLSPIVGEDRPALKLPEGVTGLIITKVEANTPAANCGLEQGDIILRINGATPATHADAVDAILNHSRDGQATLHVRKGNASRIFVMNLKE
jgi:serine protease Do